MPLIQQPTIYQMHGATFASYVAPSSGSSELCAWRVTVDPGVSGQGHRVTKEEVFLALVGEPTLTVDGDEHRLGEGSVVVAHAGSEVRLDNHASTVAELWVTTSVGLTAQLADGTTVSPPWTT